MKNIGLGVQLKSVAVTEFQNRGVKKNMKLSV